MATQKKPGPQLSLFRAETMGLVGTLVILWLCSSGDSDNFDVVYEGDTMPFVIDEERNKEYHHVKAEKIPKKEKVQEIGSINVEISSVQTIQELRQEFRPFVTESEFMRKYHPNLDKEIFYACLAMRESTGDRTSVGDAGERGYFQITDGALIDINKEYGRNLTLRDFQGKGAAMLAVWTFSAYCNRYVPEKQKSDIMACLNVWHRGSRARNWGETEYASWIMAHYYKVKSAGASYINPLPKGSNFERGVGKDAEGNDHEGFDLSCPCGRPVLATSGGEVILARYAGRWGKHIAINDGTYVWLYAHLSEGNVGTGDIVSQGKQIGLVGKTGHATGCHLHLECWTISEWNKDRAEKVAHPVKKLLWQ